MKIFTYRAYDPEGRLIKGYMAADSLESVIGLLTARNLYVFSVRGIPRFVAPLFGLLTGKVTNQDLIEFSKNLSSLLKAGIVLTTALSQLAEDAPKESIRRLIEDIRDLIEKGVSFSDALESRKDVFPEILIHLVRIGEQTGRLDKSLDDIATHFERIEELRASVKRALMYPTFAVVTTFGSMLFWIVYVLPKIVESMKGMGVKIPLMTEVLIKGGDLIKSSAYYIPFALIGFFILFPAIKKTRGYKMFFSRFSFKFPVIKEIFYNRTIALFCDQMKILIGAGITIDTAFDLTRKVITNELMSSAIERVKERVISGERISESMRKEEIFPSLVVRLVDVGETSGTLENQFDYLGTFYTTRLLDYTNKLGKILEPITIMVVGVFFAIVIVSILTPVYDLITKIGKI